MSTSSTSSGGSVDDVTAWFGEADRPELTGAPTLSLVVTPSRAEAVVPAAIGFEHNGPLSDYYYWNFGDGTTVMGSQAAHIYEEPGIYTVEIERVNPEDFTWGVATVEVRVLPFAGTTRYLDNDAGDDTADGVTPGTAWKSAEKVQNYLRNEANANQRVLFKRGQVFPLPNGVFLNLPNANLIRFAAYADSEGNDDASLPAPKIQAEPGAARSDLVYLWNVSKDIVFRDMSFEGTYEFAPAPGAGSDRQNYLLGAFNTIDVEYFAMLRVEVARLGTGVYIQGDAREFHIHDSHIHHV